MYAQVEGEAGVEHEEVTRYRLRERTNYVRESPPLDAASWNGAPELFEPGKHDVLDMQMGHTARTFLFAGEACRAPLVAIFHGFDFSGYPEMHGDDCYRMLFEVADAVTYNCEHARRGLLELGCPPQKLAKYTSALDVDQFPFRERRLEAGRADSHPHGGAANRKEKA